MTETSAQPTLPNSLTRADFEAIAGHCYEVASEIVTAGETVAPVLLAGKIADGAPDITHIIQVSTKTEQDKDCVAGLMQGLVAEPDIEFVIHIVEAWLLVSPKLPKRSIAKHPRRKEVVLFNILSKDCQILILNPLHRKPNRLERGPVDFSLDYRGRFMRPPPVRN